MYCIHGVANTWTVFPLFGDRLFQALGTDWGIGMLAFLTLGLGGPFLPLVCTIFWTGPHHKLDLVADNSLHTDIQVWTSAAGNWSEEQKEVAEVGQAQNCGGLNLGFRF